MKKALLTILISLLLITLGLIYLASSQTSAVTLESNVDLIIEEGSRTRQIAEQLEQEGIIKNAVFFTLFSRYYGVDSEYRAGRYVFAAAEWSIEDVSAMLINGGESVGDSLRVTIREGLTVRETAQVLSDAGLGDIDAYLSYAESGDFSAFDFIPAAGAIPEPGNRLDGFLFPDTYMMDPDWTEREIIDMLLAQFVQVWTNNGFDQRAAELGISIYEAVTMAALVEKEAQVAADRPVISGVFYKRLEIGMLLQTCATVQFILGEPKPVLTNADIAIDNPYNCYIYPGLPPGPIAAPGLDSLKAALYPEETDYLYFRARNDGTHRFSVTLSEHNTYHEGDQ